MKTACTAVLILMLAASAVTGQEAPAKPEAKPEPKAPFTFTGTGETIDDYKFSIVVNQKVDQSTARGTVEAYLGFTDGRDETRNAHKAAWKRWDELAAKALAPIEEKLLVADARAAMANAIAKDDSAGSRVTAAAEIAGETKAEDGSVLVESLQKTTIKTPDKTGKMNEHTREDRQRFTCAKGEDGKWRINKMEFRVHDRASRKEPEPWIEDHGQIGISYMMISRPMPEPAAAKQDTPENAAMSLYNSLKAQKERLNRRAKALVTPQWHEQIEALLTPAFIKGAKDQAAEELKELGDAVNVTVSGTGPATDGKDGMKLVKIKQSDDWRPEVQVTLKQVDGKWMVVEAGIWENVGGIDRGPQYRAIANLYKLPAP